MLDAICVQLVLNDLLLKHFVTEFELVDAVNEVLLTDEPTGPLRTCAHYRGASDLAVFNNFFKPKNLVQADKVQAKLLRTLGQFGV